MRVAIVGAGAMGTLLGNGFCKGGHEVSVLDLPDRVAQLKSVGKLVVIERNGRESAESPHLVTSDVADMGQNEVIVLATKAQDLPLLAQDVQRMVGDDSAILTIQNGIPWWYLQQLPHEFGTETIKCLDPDGLLEKFVDPTRIVGCVAYPAAAMEDDGRVRHIEGYKYPIGELDGKVRDRTETISALFESAGLQSRVLNDIRSEIWLKAWGALSINPISALTRATMEEICSFAQTRDLIAEMMSEAQQVAEKFGASFRHTIEKRIEGAHAVGPHKTSMLQDVERGHPLELDALMLAVIELAELAGVDVRAIRHVYACVALLNDNLQAQRY